MKNVMDIIERFQMHHALQEEHEMENSNVSGSGVAAPGLPGKNSIFETEEVRVSMVAIPGDNGMVAAPRWPGSTGRTFGKDGPGTTKRRRSILSRSRDLDPGKQQFHSAQ